MATPNGDMSHTKDKFAFLKAHTSESKYRGKESFYQHLFNVYSYLKAQSLPDEVCDAGLYHSVYGTEFYDFQNDSITRDIVRSYIGEYAEELAYTFCQLKKNRFDSIVNNTPGWTLKQHLDLCRLEYANFWDNKSIRNEKVNAQI
ncbi:uncharacterized protein BDR25DRAFT_316133 [Lindgomyces ingoldianus]|uniref:Uncharacterized protein n=1 Tax=Lindgomyces ingoldianus TaxID=673940 RepID=A0ACB6QMX8_9PLEO|nr:uncharacterized protein BDR25DRAFT_316133 [Lindgomyces ingoldianus]KAF2468343.1 hypothetical protein BDR25DRAFT_316133 [Lindgomyces ingoldianus]